MISKSLTPMEKSQIETLKSTERPFSLPPVRRSQLKSETFRTLVRILTHCYDDSQRSHAAHIVSEKPTIGSKDHCYDDAQRPHATHIVPEKLTLGSKDHCYDNTQRSNTTYIVPEKLTLDNGSNELRQETAKEARDEMASPDGSGSGNLSIQEDTVVDESIEATGNQGRGPSQVQMMIDELEHIMSTEDYEEPIQANSVNLLTSSTGGNQTGNGAVALINKQENYSDLQKFLMEESGDAKQVLIDGGHYSDRASKALESFSDKDIIKKVFKPSKNNNKKCSFLKMNDLEEVEHEMQHKNIEIEKPVSASSIIVSPPCMTADEEIEEGEISDDSGVYDQSMDLFLDDVVALEEKKVDEEQISEDIINKEKVICKEQKETNEKSSFYNVDIVDNVDNGIEVYDSHRNVECKSKMVVCRKTVMDKKADGYNCMPEAGRKKNQYGGSKEGFNFPKASLDDLVLNGEISEQNATDNRGITSAEKDAGNKKKRSRPSKEKKEKKKRKERMKRAEKNRQLGVKRLKLHPVLKPKTISYCKHYLKGRCQKGDECSFSHNTVPLTKSKPCCHFARNSCMKGDDCPFDHQLAKYPCNNYVSKGFCSRGDNCMFSHKMPLKDGSPTTSNVCEPELKSPSQLGNANFKKQLNFNCNSHQPVDTLSCHGGIFPRNNTKQNIAETVLKPPAQAPKGINFLSFGKSPLDDSGKHKQAGPLPKGNNVEVSNQMNQRLSDAVQILNEIPKRSPPVLAPQGIKLLTFGKAPLDCFQSKKQVTLASNRNNSPVDDSSKLKQACSSPKRDVGVKVGIQMKQSALDTFHNMQEMPKRATATMAPLGINSLSFGKAPSDDSSGKQQASMSFNRDNGINTFIQDRQSTSDKLQNSSVMPRMQPVSPLSSGQSSGRLLDGYKNTPTSVQKALLSTLAFAAKYESGMNASSVRADGHKESSSSSSISGSSQNDAMKAFDFIFGVGSKTKQ